MRGIERYGDDHIERWDGKRLIRPLRDGVAYCALALGPVEAPGWRVSVDHPRDLDAATLAAAAVLTPADSGLLNTVAATDPAVMELLACTPPVAPIHRPDLFSALVRAISAQQVNLSWAATTRGRLALAHGTACSVGGELVHRLDPAVIAQLTPARLREFQFTTRKAEYIIGCAQRIRAGELSTAALTSLCDEAALALLATTRGIGRWTAEWLLVSVMGRPLVVAGDLGVRKAVTLVYRLPQLATEAQVRALTAHWGAAAGFLQQRALWLLH